VRWGGSKGKFQEECEVVTTADLETFERDGAVTIDTSFTEVELDRAEAAWDRIKASGDPAWRDQDYVNTIQHPCFEEIAKQFLRAQSVHLWWGISPHERPVWTKPFDSQRISGRTDVTWISRQRGRTFRRRLAGCVQNCGCG
jgi:hypothetical protein